MEYLNPVEYSKYIKSLMESDQDTTEEVVSVKGEKTMKERISDLSPDDKKKLKEYIDAIKEIKKEIHDLINKESMEETGGDMMNLTLNPEE